jgi:hypothetical protein
VQRCQICGIPSDVTECASCAIAEETLWKRLSDREDD